ncbi:YIP1 family protein [Mailhella sp.]|uniref:YIP1 family protein n=1 Tax=Mailhella sp. TaxID=1981029 RepID=UPI0040635CAD
MNIQCPSCRYEREVPSSSVRPGKVYKVTCPRCAEVFQFSLPEETIGEDDSSAERPVPPAEERPAETVQTTDSAPAAEQTAKSEAAKPQADASAQAPAPESAVNEGDDPLPPGAEIPAFTREAPKPAEEMESREPKREDPEPSSVWDSWKRRVRSVDGGDEQDESYSVRTDGRPDGAPWESPEYYGFWGSFSRTLLGVIFHPADFFRHVRCSFSVIRPLLFYVLLSLFQVLCARLWSMKALQELSATTTDPQTLAMAEQLMQSMNMPLMLLITPFFSIFQAVILAGLYHLMIRMVQPDRADFATTLRVVCYSAAPLVLCIVPLFGSLIASACFVMATFVGCRYALNMPWTRTVLALLPLYILELAFVSQLPALLAV